VNDKRKEKQTNIKPRKARSKILMANCIRDQHFKQISAPLKRCKTSYFIFSLIADFEMLWLSQCVSVNNLLVFSNVNFYTAVLILQNRLHFKLLLPIGH